MKRRVHQTVMVLSCVLLAVGLASSGSAQSDTE